MNKGLKFALILSFIAITSCKVHYPTIQNLRGVNYPNLTMNDTLSVSYISNIWEVATMPERYTKWAERKKFRFIGVKLTNTSSKTIRGYQLRFYDGQERLRLLDNRWVGKKVFKQHSPIPVIGSVVGCIIGGVLLNRLGLEEGGEKVLNTPQENGEMRAEMHNNLVYELMTFDINEKILFPGEPVYGIIVAKKETEIKDLKIKITETETENYW